MSSSCDKGAEGCTDSTACNYDNTAAVDDGTCWFQSEDCNCDDPPGSIIDCLGICDSNTDNDPPIDSDGFCCANINENCHEIVVGGCKEKEYCNYDLTATHNDGSCAVDLTQFGGDSHGNDCTYPLDGACGGTAVMDGCDICIGGTTNYGKCWQIEIQSIATFILQDGTSMGSDTNSITIGTTINALDGYNGEVIDDNDINCERDYLDFPEPAYPDFPNEQNYIRFFIPHDGDDGWDEWWGSHYNFDRDIRSNDYHSIFTEDKGMNWFSVIEPSDMAIIDSIKFQITHLEGIQCSDIKFYLYRDKGETDGGIEIEDFERGIAVDTDKEINITINVSNICFQVEFDKSCPNY